MDHVLAYAGLSDAHGGESLGAASRHANGPFMNAKIGTHTVTGAMGKVTPITPHRGSTHHIQLRPRYVVREGLCEEVKIHLWFVISSLLDTHSEHIGFK